MQAGTVLITGGCGFIGSHFVRHLVTASPRRVIVLDLLTYAGNPDNLADLTGHPQVRLVRGDIADGQLVDGLLRDEPPWAIVNFAAESHVDRSILDPAPFVRANVLGVQTLLHAAHRRGVPRFLQISTDEVYGDVAAPTLSAEDAALRPSSPYAASKAAADLLCLAFRRTYGTPVVIARSANNYGPFQFPEKLIPLMIRNAMAGEPLPVYGDGGQVRDWLYVEDNCAALGCVLERGRDGEIYNVGTGWRETTNVQVVRALCRVLAEEAGLEEAALLRRIQFVPDRPGHDRRYAVDTRKIRAELGWRPRTEFEDGLRRTVRWYLGHGDWIRRATSQDYQAYYEAVYRRFWSQASP